MREATSEEKTESRSVALRFQGRRQRVNHADTFIARITAKRLVEHLRQSGFVAMKKLEGRRRLRRIATVEGRSDVYPGVRSVSN